MNSGTFGISPSKLFKTKLLNSNAMWNKIHITFYSLEAFLQDQETCILSWTTDQKTSHWYNHEVTVCSFITSDTSWIPSLMCHMLDICTGSGQKNKTTIKVQMIIGIYCVIYWSTLIKESGNSKQERYTVLLEKHPQLPPSITYPNCLIVLPRRLWKTHYGPIKGYLSPGTYSDLL